MQVPLRTVELKNIFPWQQKHGSGNLSIVYPIKLPQGRHREFLSSRNSCSWGKRNSTPETIIQPISFIKCWVTEKRFHTLGNVREASVPQGEKASWEERNWKWVLRCLRIWKEDSREWNSRSHVCEILQYWYEEKRAFVLGNRVDCMNEVNRVMMNCLSQKLVHCWVMGKNNRFWLHNWDNGNTVYGVLDYCV